MDMTAIATSLMSMSAAKNQSAANIAVLKQQFAMERSVIDLLAPTSAQPPAPQGMGQVVDKTA